MISNVCQVSKRSNHAKDLRKSSDDIRHYLVKTNNKVLTEICQSLFPERGVSEWIFVCHFNFASLSLFSGLHALLKISTYRHYLRPRAWAH